VSGPGMWPVRPMTTATAGAASLAPAVHPATGRTDEPPSCTTGYAGSHPPGPPAVRAVTRCTGGSVPGDTPRSAAAGVDRRFRPQSSPASSAVTDGSSGCSPLSARSRLIRSTIGGWVEKSPFERCSNFLIGLVK